MRFDNCCFVTKFLLSISNSLYLKDLSSKFKELKSLIYEYKDKKEDEISKLNISHQKFKDEIETNQKKYEQLIDDAADEISNFVN